MMPRSALAAAPTCLVCGTTLSPLDGRSRRVCRSVTCAWRHTALDPRQACAVCSRPLAVADWAIGVCSDAACRHTWLVERPAQANRARAESLRARARALLDAHAPQLDIESPDGVAITIVPAMEGDVAPLPEERRDALRSRIAEVLVALLSADAEPVPSETAAAEMIPVDAASIGAACGTCRGYCCRNGGEHAYLTPIELRRWLDAHPDAAADDVVDAYVSYAGGETYRGSCVYHGSGGCTLPRDMRSGTCNRFFCSELRQLLRAEPRARFVVASTDAEPVRATFVDGADVRPAVMS